jgi:hypothetical protein
MVAAKLMEGHMIQMVAQVMARITTTALSVSGFTTLKASFSESLKASNDSSRKAMAN